MKNAPRYGLILRKEILSFLFFAASIQCHAQENVTTLGIQVKPMFQSSFFGAGPQSSSSEALQVTVTPRLGWNFGMVVRRGFTKTWSLETGINLVQRNYRMDLSHPRLPKEESMNFRYICYEIPVQAMVFVKLGEQLHMNASGGFSMDFYPSNVESSGTSRKDSLVFDFYQKTWRNGWLQVALLANYGFEWRTRERGYFYFGVSYHRPFTHIGLTRVDFTEDSDPVHLQFLLKGNYITADFRYFFNEKPERRKTKTR